MFCLCAPTGGGKSTLSKKLLSEYSDSMNLSISVTTRKPRENEINGEQYHFISREEFEQAIDGSKFFEWEEVHGFYYGTLKSTITDAFNASKDLVLDVDIRGSQSFATAYPVNTVVVFIVPPSLSELKKRITSRAQIDQDELDRRIDTAKQEFETLKEAYELERFKVDYLILNDDLDLAYNSLRSIVDSERNKLERYGDNTVLNFLDSFFSE